MLAEQGAFTSFKPPRLSRNGWSSLQSFLEKLVWGFRNMPGAVSDQAPVQFGFNVQETLLTLAPYKSGPACKNTRGRQTAGRGLHQGFGAQ